MPYADITKRREAQRRRYWAKQGVAYPETDNSQPDQTRSSPDSSPVGERVPGFSSAGKRKLNLFASIRPHLGELLALIAGLGAGIGVEIATHNIQVKAGEEIKKLVATRRKAEPLTVTERSNQSMAGLLDYADEVMGKAASSASS
jgi:hypothetical protein